jgi:hypothetical protein
MTPGQIVYWISDWVRGRLAVLYLDTHDEIELRREVAELDDEKRDALWAFRKEARENTVSRTKLDMLPPNEFV